MNRLAAFTAGVALAFVGCASTAEQATKASVAAETPKTDVTTVWVVETQGGG